MTHWEKPWCWERLKEGREGDDRGLDGWMASLTRWTWIWVNSESWWWTGRPGVVRFMGSQRVRHDWTTELNWKWRYMRIYCDKGKYKSICKVLWETKGGSQSVLGSYRDFCRVGKALWVKLSVGPEWCWTWLSSNRKPFFPFFFFLNCPPS